eukprot:CAMPEP_0117027330 /NCGR_PEP_ID=MMETSP0472-20121206/19987_1 /TAXON_ID=693140 ORGANISM="Tiarina fusus, Strain LIS" /NCGR_SAMPLE_ID=MMETSP0472 /ASSEMBLY_ACC=CAM_ASM_000603 /LENGTH=216 /DNA_ID=CAMNT_0004734545 /DNA_START=195 /DNA_END=842 /DNA_ORIENTATION=+
MESNSSGTFQLESNVSVNIDDIEDLDLDWDLPQELRTPTVSTSLQGNSFGFNNRFYDYFDDLLEELSEITELPDNPRNISIEKRREIRVNRENEKFNIDHYMADFMEDEMIQEILRFSIDWEILEMENPTPKPLNSQNSQNSQFTKSQPLVTGITGAEKSVFSEKEKEILRNLPNKEFLMTKREQKIAMLNLLDILLAFTYDLRSTFGIHTVESGW